jgi:hypothetical protein
MWERYSGVARYAIGLESKELWPTIDVIVENDPRGGCLG